MKRLPLALLFLLVCPTLALGWPVVGDMIDLATLPGVDTFVPIARATDINDQGDVVGWSVQDASNQEHAVLWTAGGGIQDLGSPTGASARITAAAINNHRQIVVNYLDGAYHAYLYQAGAWQALSLPQPWCESVAHDINDNGWVVGKTCGPNGRWQASVWMPDGTIRFLGTLGGSESEGFAINAQGWVTGDSRTPEDYIHAFLWKGAGAMIDLGTLGVAGDNYSFGRGINASGKVVGDVPNWRGSHAVVWSAEGVATALPTLPDGWISSATGINDAGDVVGWSNAKWDSPSGYEVVHATVWSGGQPKSLGTIMDNPLQASWGQAINQVGQVAGFGEATGGWMHAFLWQIGNAEVVDLAEYAVSGVRRLALLRRNPTGNPVNFVDLRNSATNKRIRTFTALAGNYLPKGMAVTVDLNGNLSPDLALLGYDAAAGRVRVVVRDGKDGAIIANHDFNATYTPRAVTAMELDGQPALAVAGVRPSDGAVRVEVRDARTGALIKQMSQPKQ